MHQFTVIFLMHYYIYSGSKSGSRLLSWSQGLIGFLQNFSCGRIPPPDTGTETLSGSQKIPNITFGIYTVSTRYFS